MKVEIRIGNVNSGVRKKYTTEKYDNLNEEKNRMYNFLTNSMDCIIEDVDNYLLYTLNNGLMAFIVKDNPKIKDEDFKCEDYNLVPKFNPEIYRVYEVNEDGTEKSIQDTDGNILDNYFNNLMNNIMNDYYSCLAFYE